MSLRTLLLGLNAGLVLLAVLALAAASVGVLGRLAEEQALARVSLAGAAAREAVQRSGSEVETAARLLAERPTLRRLLQEKDAAALTAFLERFCRTGHLTSCAVFVAGSPFAASGEPPAPASGSGWRIAPAPPGGLSLTAAADVSGEPGTRVLTAARLDARDLQRQVGLPVALVPLAAGPPPTPRREGERFLSVLPLATPGRGVEVLVEVAMPRSAALGTLQRRVRNLLFFALLVALFALGSGFLIARWIGQPVQALTAAAARLGRGDFSTPVAAAGGAEIASLGTAMEEMRRQLRALTAELRRRQAEAEAVLTGIAEGVFAVDAERRVQYLNPQAARLLGVAPEAAVGRFCGDLLNPRGPDGLRPCDEQCPIVHARFRGSARATEHLSLPGGARRTVVVTSSGPAEERQFQVLRDETETEATRRLRDAVLANVSHEFRTPLAAQLAALELLRDRLAAPGAGSDAETGQLVASLERGSLRLTQLVDNLLESVRIEAGEDGIRRRPVALDEVIEAAVELTRPLLDQRGQRLTVELPYPLPVVEGDAPRLTQVFVNLLGNANKFAPAGSALRIGGEVRPGEVALWVEDEGPGLPAGSEARLFERFVRTASAAGEEPEESGMGLGLWIVKSIVERHGGRVEALAAPPGTRVRLVLPVEGRA